MIKIYSSEKETIMIVVKEKEALVRELEEKLAGIEMKKRKI
jgi:hypothetical protein